MMTPKAQDANMLTRNLTILTVILTFAGGAVLSADRIKLRSGRTIDGSFLSADVKTVRLLLANGAIAEFPVDDISAVEFSTRKAPPPPVPDPSRAPSSLTVPAGTILNVRLVDAIDVDTARAGMTFKSLLDDPVMLKGAVVVPRGSIVVLQAVKVEQAGKIKGADKITLKANSIAFGGNKYEIVTTSVESKGGGEGKKSARKIGGGAGLGAVVGGIAGGGSGAAIGAVAGGATGAIVASQGTEHLTLPAETRLQFSLDAAVTVRL
jgi:hypothetical protein